MASVAYLLLALCVCSLLSIAVCVPGEDELIDDIVRLWLDWKPLACILAYLQKKHGVQKSLSWLKRILRNLGLKRRRGRKSAQELAGVVTAIDKELRSSNCSIGYRQMRRVIYDKYGLLVRRDLVMHLLRVMDPHRTEARKCRRLKRRVYRNKGPNYVWHLDGYDKLAPFGICVHGCIDGYSRKIMWLKVTPTNHNPGVVVTYFLDTIGEVGGCPRVVRSDCGTENCLVAAAQVAFRAEGVGDLAGAKSYRYGRSTTNTRIEAWWSQLVRHKTGWWINIFKELVDDGYMFTDNETKQLCFYYVFVDLIEQDLQAFVMWWNDHLEFLMTFIPYRK